MNQKQILPLLEVNCCPFKHNNLCSREWSAKFINHEIICNCECHNKKIVLEKDNIYHDNSNEITVIAELDAFGEFNK